MQLFYNLKHHYCYSLLLTRSAFMLLVSAMLSLNNIFVVRHRFINESEINMLVTRWSMWFKVKAYKKSVRLKQIYGVFQVKFTFFISDTSLILLKCSGYAKFCVDKTKHVSFLICYCHFCSICGIVFIFRRVFLSFPNGRMSRVTIGPGWLAMSYIGRDWICRN